MQVVSMLDGAGIAVDVVVIDRGGTILAHVGPP